MSKGQLDKGGRVGSGREHSRRWEYSKALWWGHLKKQEKSGTGAQRTRSREKSLRCLRQELNLDSKLILLLHGR